VQNQQTQICLIFFGIKCVEGRQTHQQWNIFGKKYICVFRKVQKIQKATKTTKKDLVNSNGEKACGQQAILKPQRLICGDTCTKLSLFKE